MKLNTTKKSGKTTRLIDRFVQELFTNGVTNVYEERNKSKFDEELLEKFMNRIKLEHPNVKLRRTLKKDFGFYYCQVKLITQPKLLWLDDYRDPLDTETDWMMFSPIGRDVEVHWVKSFDEFTTWINENGLPDGIAFDHDLDDSHYAPKEFWDGSYNEWAKAQNFTEKTGYDAALWLTNYCLDNNENLPMFSSQSANPVGRENITKLLTNFLISEIRKLND